MNLTIVLILFLIKTLANFYSKSFIFIVTKIRNTGTEEIV